MTDADFGTTEELEKDFVWTGNAPVPSLPVITAEDVRNLLRDKPFEVPGIHAVSDLYGWYCAQMKDMGRKPVSKREFGGMFRKMACRSMTRVNGGVRARCWHITRAIWTTEPI